ERACRLGRCNRGGGGGARPGKERGDRGRAQSGSFELAPAIVDRLVAERLNRLRPVEQSQALVWTEAVLHVPVLEDLSESASSSVLANHVRGHALLCARSGEEKGEWGAQQACQSLHRGDCILACGRRISTEGRFSDRVVHGVDDAGAAETIVIW